MKTSAGAQTEEGGFSNWRWCWWWAVVLQPQRHLLHHRDSDTLWVYLTALHWPWAPPMSQLQVNNLFTIITAWFLSFEGSKSDETGCIFFASSFLNTGSDLSADRAWISFVAYLLKWIETMMDSYRCRSSTMKWGSMGSSQQMERSR